MNIEDGALWFNPKSEKSYLYLAKIFNESSEDEQEEINLNKGQYG